MLFSRYSNYCLHFLIVYKNSLIRETRLISKYMTSQHGCKTIIIHTLPNMSRRKGTQTMNFGQAIEYHMKMIFLKKSLAKCVGETIPRSFYKKSKLNISLDQLSKVSYNLFLLHAKLKAITKY